MDPNNPQAFQFQPQPQPQPFPQSQSQPVSQPAQVFPVAPQPANGPQFGQVQHAAPQPQFGAPTPAPYQYPQAAQVVPAAASPKFGSFEDELAAMRAGGMTFVPTFIEQARAILKQYFPQNVG